MAKIRFRVVLDQVPAEIERLVAATLWAELASL